MAHNKMLIDATHPEETRVVVLRDGRVEEFDYESAAKKLLRGNIYLAKVTRVEPSLQAAFIEYGGNRHGFLAFNEIHPDYYQIPVADREALKREEALSREEEDDTVGEDVAAAPEPAHGEERPPSAGLVLDAPDTDSEPEEIGGEALPFEGAARTVPEPHSGREATLRSDYDARISELPQEPAPADRETPSHDHGQSHARDHGYEAPAHDHAHHDHEHHGHEHAPSAEHVPQSQHHESIAHDAPVTGEVSTPHQEQPQPIDEARNGGLIDAPAHGESGAPPVERTGGEDVLEEMPERRPRRQRTRSYKIQEVIKRRQIILVQVVKEERGNKGAALTTYLSLAGRYTVLMPNTGRGGGISRKITDPADRKRLKKIAQELEVPEGMGLIIRTAGASRTKADIKRDFEYLLRLWESIRDLTLQSTAPALVYAEGDLIKRSIRDLYSKDIDQILVAGTEAYQDASTFMGMLMPSHVDSVVAYQEPEPLFNRYQIERQLNAMFSPYVTLRSGGYIVINQTEALVSVDVNSGRSTREYSIEETALNTNLEAADEIARQLKLRDLAGLIVIDFIDMEEKRNNRAVERRMKEALRFDRARIQVGRISHFGLMEMSRQRLRTGVLEGSTTQCAHCQGTGVIRSTESVALAVLRALEDALMAGERGSPLKAETTAEVALYILNEKRIFINDMEGRYGLKIVIEANARLQGANFQVVKSAHQAVETPSTRPLPKAAVRMDYSAAEPVAEPAPREREHDRNGDEEGPASAMAPGSGDDRRGRRKRRRRGRGRDRGEGFHDEGRGSNGHHNAAAPANGSHDSEADEATVGEAGGFVGSEREQPSARHVDPANAEQPYIESDAPFAEDEPAEAGQEANGRREPQEGQSDGEERSRRRRRGRRGGRRGRGDRPQHGGSPAQGESQGGTEAEPYAHTANGERVSHAGYQDAGSPDVTSAPAYHGEPAPAQAHHAQEAAAQHEARDVEPPAPVPQHFSEPAHATQVSEPVVEARPRRSHHHPADVPVEVEPASPTSAGGDAGKRGWWQRRFGG